jgi:hypothetical protein
MLLHELFYNIFEGYPEAIVTFTQQSGDKNQVQTTIDAYKKLVNKNQVQGNERNIDWWRKQGWDKFKKFVDSKSTQPTATQVKRKRASGQSITLKETDSWLIVVPLDHDASCFHGRNTEWCTARPTGHYFDKYFLDDEVNLIYVLNKQTGGKWAIASHVKIDQIELFNQQDQSINETQFKQQTGFDARELIKLLPVNDSRIAQARTTRRELLDTLRYKLQVWQSRRMFHRDTEIEELLIKSKHGGSCYDYMSAVGKYHGPSEFPEIIQLAGVRYRGRAIKYIKDPKPSVQIATVKNSGIAIYYIIKAGIKPSEAVQQEAVKTDYHAFKSILAAYPEITPSEELQLYAVEQEPEYIKLIIDTGIRPSDRVQMQAVKNNIRVFRDIVLAEVDPPIIPSEELQLYAVDESNVAIIHILNAGIKPSDRVQIAAIENDSYAVTHLRDAGIELSDKVKQTVKREYPLLYRTLSF